MKVHELRSYLATFPQDIDVVLYIENILPGEEEDWAYVHVGKDDFETGYMVPIEGEDSEALLTWGDSEDPNAKEYLAI